MAASSVAEKLGIKRGYHVCVMNAPENYEELLGELPEGVTLHYDSGSDVEVVHLFAKDRGAFEVGWPAARAALRGGGRLWVSYPKKSSGVQTDLDRDWGWKAAAADEWRPVTQVSVDDTWSALRFRPASEVGS